MTAHPAHRTSLTLSPVLSGAPPARWLRWLESLPWTGLSLALAVAGLLLVVALPRSQESERALALERMELELQRNLDHLRGALAAYHADHGAWPGRAFDPRSDRVVQSSHLFARQLLTRTDRAGRPSLAELPSHPFGPYLESLPGNAANGLASVQVLAPGERMPAGPDGLTGWIYDPRSGELRANCDGELHRAGVRFYDL